MVPCLGEGDSFDTVNEFDAFKSEGARYLKSIQGDCMKSCFLKILGTWPLSRAKGSVGN